MTPKQKANQLMESFYNTSISTVPPTKTEVQTMAIIAIEETIEQLKEAKATRNIDFLEQVRVEIINQ